MVLLHTRAQDQSFDWKSNKRVSQRDPQDGAKSFKVQFPTRREVLNLLVSWFNISFVLFISARHRETEASRLSECRQWLCHFSFCLARS